MGEERLLPLFPLPVVLFPGAALPLHIFEERYRLMIGEAVRDGSEFGVLLVDDGKLTTVGCTATVKRVVREYDEGEFDVAAEGQRRYRTLSLDQTKPYLQARVEFFDDEEIAPPDSDRLKLVVDLSARITSALRSAALPALDAAALPSVVIAHHLPLDLAFKQQLLAKRAESERLEALAAHLRELLQRVQSIQRTQQSAKTNGQAGLH
jgi:Lon protease-like protein